MSATQPVGSCFSHLFFGDLPIPWPHLPGAQFVIPLRYYVFLLICIIMSINSLLSSLSCLLSPFSRDFRCSRPRRLVVSLFLALNMRWFKSFLISSLCSCDSTRIQGGTSTSWSTPISPTVTRAVLFYRVFPFPFQIIYCMGLSRFLRKDGSNIK